MRCLDLSSELHDFTSGSWITNASKSALPAWVYLINFIQIQVTSLLICCFCCSRVQLVGCILHLIVSWSRKNVHTIINSVFYKSTLGFNVPQQVKRRKNGETKRGRAGTSEPSVIWVGQWQSVIIISSRNNADLKITFSSSEGINYIWMYMLSALYWAVKYLMHICSRYNPDQLHCGDTLWLITSTAADDSVKHKNNTGWTVLAATSLHKAASCNVGKATSLMILTTDYPTQAPVPCM